MVSLYLGDLGCLGGGGKIPNFYFSGVVLHCSITCKSTRAMR